MCQSFIFLMTHQLPCVIMLLDWHKSGTCTCTCAYLSVCVCECMHTRASVHVAERNRKDFRHSFFLTLNTCQLLAQFSPDHPTLGLSCLSGFSSQLWADNISMPCLMSCSISDLIVDLIRSIDNLAGWLVPKHVLSQDTHILILQELIS